MERTSILMMLEHSTVSVSGQWKLMVQKQQLQDVIGTLSLFTPLAVGDQMSAIRGIVLRNKWTVNEHIFPTMAWQLLCSWLILANISNCVEVQNTLICEQPCNSIDSVCLMISEWYLLSIYLV